MVWESLTQKVAAGWLLEGAENNLWTENEQKHGGGVAGREGKAGEGKKGRGGEREEPVRALGRIWAVLWVVGKQGQDGRSLGIWPLFTDSVWWQQGDPLGAGQGHLRDHYKSSGREEESRDTHRSKKNRKEEVVVSTPTGWAVEWIWKWKVRRRRDLSPCSGF